MIFDKTLGFPSKIIMVGGGRRVVRLLSLVTPGERLGEGPERAVSFNSAPHPVCSVLICCPLWLTTLLNRSKARSPPFGTPFRALAREGGRKPQVGPEGRRAMSLVGADGDGLTCWITTTTGPKTPVSKQ